jgi:hypothetical protein
MLVISQLTFLYQIQKNLRTLQHGSLLNDLLSQVKKTNKNV